MKFGDLIKDLRQSRDLTQHEVAESVEISRSVLSQYENNFVEPTAYVVKRLAMFFDVSADYLLGLEDDFGARTSTTAAPMGDSYSSEERRIIEQYRNLPEQLRKLVRQQLDVYSSSEVLPKNEKK